MEGSDVVAKLSEWITRTGYPLELRTGNLLKKELPKWEVYPGFTYFDAPETEENVREIDLLVETNLPSEHLEVMYSAVIECKNTRQPWVGFTNNLIAKFDGDATLFDPTVLSFVTVHDPTDPKKRLESTRRALKLHLGSSGPCRTPPAHILTEGHRQPGQRDAAFNAIRQVVSAASYISKGMLHAPPYTGYAIAVVAPVIVTSGRIFSATYRDDTDSIELAEVDRLSVEHSRRTEGHIKTTKVDVITEHALPSLLDDLRPLLRSTRSFIDEFDPTSLPEREWPFEGSIS